MRGADEAPAEDGVDGEPLSLNPDFGPHVKAHGRPARPVDIEQSEGGAGGHSGGAAHGGGQHGVLGARSEERRVGKECRL